MLHSNYNENNPLFKGLIVKNFNLNSNNQYEAHLEMPHKEQVCPHCGRKTAKIKDYRTQIFKDSKIFGSETYVYLRKRRYLCTFCNKSFTENNPLIHRYQHFSSRFHKEIFKEFVSIQSFSSISKRFRVSVTSIMRWFDNVSYSLPKLPESIAIDEFRGNAGGEKFQCNLSDPVSHKVIDILPNRTSEDLCKHFLKYTYKDRAKVKKVVMDLSTLFRSVVKTIFPEAKIIADKFHVIRVVINSLENVRKRIQRQFRAEKRKWFKRSRQLLLKPNYKLTPDDKIILNRILNSSPELEKAYMLKEEFYKIFRKDTRNAAKKELGDWLLLAAKLSIPEFQHCITTFTSWRTEIANIIGETLSNGFIEGSNNKIKVLKRISFGVQNFDRFRNRILHLCS